MSFKKASMVAMLAVSMASTPVLAQSASSLSVAPVRAGAEVTDANDVNGGWFIPLLAVLAVIGGIIAITGGNDDPPTSP